MFAAEDVHWLLDLLEGLEVPAWIDGGWGVDALVGEQTRAHDDLDLVIEEEHGLRVVEALQAHGYREVPTPFTTAYHTVWRDRRGRTIDLHLIRLTAEGDGLYGPDGDAYPADALSGTGTIADRPVRCMTANAQIAFHLGYEPDADDTHDVHLLCRHFGLPVPEPYAGLAERGLAGHARRRGG